MYQPRTGRNPSWYEYPDDADYYARGPPQQAPGPPRRRFNPPPPQDFPPYHRYRDDRDRDGAWQTEPPLAPQLHRRQASQTTNSTSEYAQRPRMRRGRSVSTPRGKSTSPRRHATPLPAAPPLPQPSLSEREALARQRLQTTFENYVFSTLPTHLLRVTDMTLVTRAEIWESFKPRIESLSDSHLAKLLLEQDEEARKLGVSVIDTAVIAPFTDYVRAMISFAVLSHRWGNGEPSFHELPSKRVQVNRRMSPSGPGYQKLLKFCEKARVDYGCEYVWTDTCCINKESSAELEEAILSMGVWYTEAGVCIVHLGNSLTLEDFMQDPWFTRGWTLQELLLPRKLRFYGRDWSPICPVMVEGRREERVARETREEQRVNDKDNDSVIAALIDVTGIPEADIRHFVPDCTRVAEKMRWASQRTTSRIEDTAYSMLGLFDVGMPIAYGDGHRAFYKLMSTLAEQCTEPDFFAWAGKPSQWSLALPSSPQCYSPSASQGDLIVPSSTLGDSGYELSKLGLHIRLVLVPAHCELLEATDTTTARFLLTPALATVQEAIQIFLPLAATLQQGYSVPSRSRNDYEYDSRSGESERDVPGGRGWDNPVQQGYGPPRSRNDYDYDPRLGEREHDVPVGRGRESAAPQGYGPGASWARNDYEYDLRHGQRERDVPTGRGREYALGIVDYDGRTGPAGYAAVHGGRVHLCLVLERERRGKEWVRVARPGALSVRFRESELLPVSNVCLLHRASYST